MTNPFDSMSINGDLDHATTLARIFATSHGTSEWPVHHCIRFARKMNDLPEGDYLSGCHFTHYTHMGELDDGAVEELRDLAQKFLADIATL